MHQILHFSSLGLCICFTPGRSQLPGEHTSLLTEAHGANITYNSHHIQTGIQSRLSEPMPYDNIAATDSNSQPSDYEMSTTTALSQLLLIRAQALFTCLELYMNYTSHWFEVSICVQTTITSQSPFTPLCLPIMT